MTNPEPIMLICAPATTRFTASGSVFDRKCSRCGQNVAMAPSGQAFYKDHPEAVIVCHRCVKVADVEGVEIQTAGSPQEIANEIASAKPNTWRNRN